MSSITTFSIFFFFSNVFLLIMLRTSICFSDLYQENVMETLLSQKHVRNLTFSFFHNSHYVGLSIGNFFQVGSVDAKRTFMISTFKGCVTFCHWLTIQKRKRNWQNGEDCGEEERSSRSTLSRFGTLLVYRRCSQWRSLQKTGLSTKALTNFLIVRN